MPEPIKADRFRAVTLDLDGTLIDDDAGTVHATTRIVDGLSQRHGIERETILRVHQAAYRRVWAPVLAAPPPTTPEAWDPGPVITRVWETTLTEVGIGIDHQLPGIVEQWLAAYAHGCDEYVDAAGAVDELTHAGYRLGIITNGAPRIQWPKIRRGGYEGRVGRVTIAGEAGFGKPHRQAFMATLEFLGVPPSDAVHVGDSLYADVGGAKAAGMKAVWINRTGAAPQTGAATPDAVIASMAELPRVLASL